MRPLSVLVSTSSASGGEFHPMGYVASVSKLDSHQNLQTFVSGYCLTWTSHANQRHEVPESGRSDRLFLLALLSFFQVFVLTLCFNRFLLFPIFTRLIEFVRFRIAPAFIVFAIKPIVEVSTGAPSAFGVRVFLQQVPFDLRVIQPICTLPGPDLPLGPFT